MSTANMDLIETKVDAIAMVDNAKGILYGPYLVRHLIVCNISEFSTLLRNRYYQFCMNNKLSDLHPRYIRVLNDTIFVNVVCVRLKTHASISAKLNSTRLQ